MKLIERDAADDRHPAAPPWTLRFSWSDVRNWQSCPRGWYFRTLLRLKPRQPDGAPPPEPYYPMLWGAAMHGLLGLVSQGPTATELSDAVGAQTAELPSDPKGIYTPQHLEAYATALLELWPEDVKVDATEWGFVWDVSTAEPPDAEGSGALPAIQFCGILDLTVTIGDLVCVGELKTSSRRSPIDRFLTLPIDWQCQGYCCGLSGKTRHIVRHVWPLDVIVHKNPVPRDLVTLGPVTPVASLRDFYTQLKMTLYVMATLAWEVLRHDYEKGSSLPSPLEHVRFAQHCKSCGIYNRLCDYQPMCTTTGGFHGHGPNWADVYETVAHTDPPVVFEEVPNPWLYARFDGTGADEPATP